MMSTRGMSQRKRALAHTGDFRIPLRDEIDLACPA
jgi:hypothetical protein